MENNMNNFYRNGIVTTCEHYVLNQLYEKTEDNATLNKKLDFMTNAYHEVEKILSEILNFATVYNADHIGGGVMKEFEPEEFDNLVALLEEYAPKRYEEYKAAVKAAEDAKNINLDLTLERGENNG